MYIKYNMSITQIWELIEEKEEMVELLERNITEVDYQNNNHWKSRDRYKKEIQNLDLLLISIDNSRINDLDRKNRLLF